MTTDPLDLEALKERAREYRCHRDRSFEATYVVATVLSDLDRAIEIAKQARQDVLLLRDALRARACKEVGGLAGCPGCEALQATAHYEQHRQTQEGEE